MSSYQKKKASEGKLHDDFTATQENNSLETVRSRMDLLKQKKITVNLFLEHFQVGIDFEQSLFF